MYSQDAAAVYARACREEQLFLTFYMEGQGWFPAPTPIPKPPGAKYSTDYLKDAIGMGVAVAMQSGNPTHLMISTVKITPERIVECTTQYCGWVVALIELQPDFDA